MSELAVVIMLMILLAASLGISFAIGVRANELYVQSEHYEELYDRAIGDLHTAQWERNEARVNEAWNANVLHVSQINEKRLEAENTKLKRELVNLRRRLENIVGSENVEYISRPQDSRKILRTVKELKHVVRSDSADGAGAVSDSDDTSPISVDKVPEGRSGGSGVAEHQADSPPPAGFRPSPRKRTGRSKRT